ncbi:MAG: hypothetical protein WC437_02555 [Patescibacteria group bacterium]|jgi:hypothetical protein|nr:hypothetical protein [Patescibacteria group bacterium]
MNKKNILIIIGLSIVVVLPLVVILYLQQTSVSHYSGLFQKLTNDNGWSKPKDYEGCKKDQKNCITIATAFIDDGTYSKAYYSGYDLNSLQTDVKKIEDLVNNKKYKQAYKQSKKTLESVNKNFDVYINENSENFNQIDTLIYGKDPKVVTFTNVNYQIVGDWAKVTMFPNNAKTEPASVILKKNQNGWSIIEEPGTIFEKNVLNKYPDMPSDFIKEPKRNPSGIIIVNKNGKKPPESFTTNNSMKTLVDPLSRLLPHYTDTYVVESEMINSLPVYTVSYYNTNGNTLEKTKSDFKAWLKEVGVDIKDSSIIYKDINKSDDSINVVD